MPEQTKAPAATEVATNKPVAAAKSESMVDVYVLPRGGDWGSYRRDGVEFASPGPTKIPESRVTERMLNDPFLRVVGSDGKPMSTLSNQVVVSATDAGDGRSTLPLLPSAGGGRPQLQTRDVEDNDPGHTQEEENVPGGESKPASSAARGAKTEDK